MLTYSGCGVGGAEAENGSPAGSLLSGEGELAEEAGDSPGTSRDTEEEATLSDEFYSHDTDEDEEQGKRRRDRSSSVSKILNRSPVFNYIFRDFNCRWIQQIFKSVFYSISSLISLIWNTNNLQICSLMKFTIIS